MADAPHGSTLAVAETGRPNAALVVEADAPEGDEYAVKRRLAEARVRT